jgi:hypothetical protein
MKPVTSTTRHDLSNARRSTALALRRNVVHASRQLIQGVRRASLSPETIDFYQLMLKVHGFCAVIATKR